MVGGLGFLGGGLIMKTKNHISGLTTAAGLWVTGAVGLAMGSGMYEMAILCAVLMIVCMEALTFSSLKFGHQEVAVVLAAKDEQALRTAVDSIGKQVHRLNISQHDGRYQAEIYLTTPKQKSGLDLFNQLSAMKDVELISME